MLRSLIKSTLRINQLQKINQRFLAEWNKENHQFNAGTKEQEKPAEWNKEFQKSAEKDSSMQGQKDSSTQGQKDSYLKDENDSSMKDHKNSSLKDDKDKSKTSKPKGTEGKQESPLSTAKTSEHDTLEMTKDKEDLRVK